jgi:hypothetical protein
VVLATLKKIADHVCVVAEKTRDRRFSDADFATQLAQRADTVSTPPFVFPCYGGAVSGHLRGAVLPLEHGDHLGAADSVLDHAAKAIEIEDIEARVSDLERAAETARQSR